MCIFGETREAINPAILFLPGFSFEKQSVWVYSNKKGKEKRTRHKLSFNVLTKKSNALKSKCATFANFIHQKDALIAINTISCFYKTYGEKPGARLFRI